MIDTHCHIDLYSNPHSIVDECEQLGIITIGVTNLPSHFEMGFNHVKSYKRVRLALGMHPLYSQVHNKEMGLFIKNLSKTSYIGEVGLDYSNEGIESKHIQLETFNRILSLIQGQKKILSIHSRKAEKDVLELLTQYKIPNAIFHWYTGGLTLIDNISNSGYYFSINPAMIKSKSGQNIIKRIPREKILTESDGPFISIQSRPIKPSDMNLVIDYLSSLWSMSKEEVNKTINQNFRNLINNII